MEERASLYWRFKQNFYRPKANGGVKSDVQLQRKPYTRVLAVEDMQREKLTTVAL